MPAFSPWQSWSPLHPHLWRLPTWDYCPLPTFKEKPLHSQSEPSKKPISYWCSWYAFGEKISEQIILQQAALLQKNQPKIDYILIDDGWSKWGDWNKPDLAKFPGGIVKVSQKLAQAKFKTGLWLAPFLADQKSQLFKDHPEYFLRDEAGHLVNGFRSVPPIDRILKPRFLLDFSQNEVKKYLFESLDQMINDWGISLLKLDFLYAPYFNPHLQNTKLASRQVQSLLKHLKTEHPQVFTIACGCPFSDARGLVDAVRISKDISTPPPWPNFIRKKIYQHRVNMLFEKAHHPSLWQGCLADPDVRMFTLEDQKTKTTFDELAKRKDFIVGFGDEMRKE